MGPGVAIRVAARVVAVWVGVPVGFREGLWTLARLVRLLSPGRGRIFLVQGRAREVPMFEGIFSPPKLLLIAVVVLIFIGPKRLPQIGRSVGRWLGDLRRATGGIADELKEGLAEPPAPTPVPPPAAVPPTARFRRSSGRGR